MPTEALLGRSAVQVRLRLSSLQLQPLNRIHEPLAHCRFQFLWRATSIQGLDRFVLLI